MGAFLPLWVGLVETFGVAGALMVLVYGALIVLLVLALAVSLLRGAARPFRRYRLRRELRRIQCEAYRSHRRSQRGCFDWP